MNQLPTTPVLRGHGITAASYLHGVFQTVVNCSRAANDGSWVGLSLSPGDDVVHVSLLISLHVVVYAVPNG